MAAGEEVQLIGFGTFAAKERPARIGRNPQTGGTLEIKASRPPRFQGRQAVQGRTQPLSTRAAREAALSFLDTKPPE